MASCEPPYLLDLGCSDETFWDNSTADHGADCGGEARPPDDALSERERERQARSERSQWFFTEGGPGVLPLRRAGPAHRPGPPDGVAADVVGGIRVTG